ncbi:FAD-dependent monooxygenase [Kibdelosporangium persicum]|uniref:Auricin polyketide oxiygenase n=1 Tax=Kibdelosporangium persicum TaxID=2698649 RepID=A0ABX2F7A3_9PSEU|nr:FAD-dependent monooxygenase [Kibdelosporangium persicum]NRN67234.1 Auricin polyketide oxiygenase [Kibdelosporangium persicum]
MDTAVVVVGAGPAGLMLAGELQLAGVDVVVVEKLARPTGESRGLGFTVRTMEVFDQRGLLPRFGDLTTTSYHHFGGLTLDLGVLDGVHLANKTVMQWQTEKVLEEWATELGAEIRRGHELVSLTQNDAGVEIEVNGPQGAYRLRGAYLVGCDGGRSKVRKSAGFDFPGIPATMEMFLADVKDVRVRERRYGETVPGGLVMAGHLPEGLTRLVICEHAAVPKPRTSPATFDEVVAAWKRLTGEDISGGTPVWTSSYGNAVRQVTSYRMGRVLLAGDSAHIHLPAGGQGMNVSIQDSVNLGWKLAAVVRGTAPADLLDTYHSERHPVGRRLLTNTQAQGLLFLGGTEIQPLRDVISELIEYEDVSRHLARMVSGLDIQYDMGEGDHPLLGRRVPHVDLVHEDGKTSTTELLHAGRGVLLDCAGNAGLRKAAAAWSDRVEIVTAAPVDNGTDSPLHGADAYLIRPDGHLAWATGSKAGLPAALERWFGPA